MTHEYNAPETGLTDAEQAAWHAGIEAGREIERNNAAASAEPIHQFRTRNCADWYDGLPDTNDGKDYETRTLYTAPVAAQAQPSSASVAWEIRSSVTPASVELTPYIARAQEAWLQGFDVHDLVRRTATPVAAQPQPSGNAGELPTELDDLKLAYASACEERDHLRAALAAQTGGQDREDALPDRTGVYAWVSGSAVALVLVDKRPSSHAPGGQLNGHVIGSTKCYDGCAVADWGKGRWVMLHDIHVASAAAKEQS